MRGGRSRSPAMPALGPPPRMMGGTLEITGNAGDRLGGPLAGEMTGMRGGIVIVRGHAGERAGDRLRRGTIVVEGGAGAMPAAG